MVGFNTATWGELNRWSAQLYRLAGVVLAVYAAANGLVAFTALSLDATVLQAGYIAGFLGLLGLYPRVADRSPWLARAGAAAAALGVFVFTISTLNNLAELAGVAVGNIPGMPVVTVIGVIAFVIGYPVVGVATLRSETYSRTVGLLLLVPGIIIVLMLATIVTEVVSPVSVFVVSAGQAMTHLALGATLTVETDPADQREPESTSDATEEDSTVA